MKDQETIILKQALQQIRSLKKSLNNTISREPIAVIGMSCRFPGGCDSPEKFWDFLKAGREGLCDFPRDADKKRVFFDDNTGKPEELYIDQSNFLQEDVSLFDAKLFNISPREAEEIDPQHRLLLELTWEALERAGQSPGESMEKAIGTFIGIISSEYGTITRDPSTMSPYSLTGIALHMASGRIAHTFGFQGPAISYDTACSSSLAAIHYACESLQNNECRMAIAGGVGLMISPAPFQALCKAGALSRDGRCKPFSAEGDGYGRGEGAGLVLLKRLSEAQKDRDPILAVVQASALNHDGPSSGLTVPNGKAQKQLLQKTIELSGVKPDDIGYIEAHGTGTPLGDPIEFEALKHVFGQNRDAGNPLVLGTCKANIGHLEAASGVAGFIKTVLCLQNKAIPPHINCPTLSPRIKLDTIPAMLPSSLHEWRVPANKSRFAGLSSFGFSGTNAHMILKEASPEHPVPAEPSGERPFHILTISAQNPEAFNELAGKYTSFFSPLTEAESVSSAFTINRGRAHFNRRLACVWSHHDELLSHLKSIKPDMEPGENRYYNAHDTLKAPKMVMIFPGDSPVDPAVISPLLSKIPYLQYLWEQCEKELNPYLDTPLSTLLTEKHDENAENTVQRAALMFSTTYSLFKLYQYWGIQMHTVYAEKDGIYAMAAATEMMSLDAAVKQLMRHYGHTSSDPAHIALTRMQIILPGKNNALKKADFQDVRLFENAYASTPNYTTAKSLFPKDNHMFCEFNSGSTVLKRIYGDEATSVDHVAVLRADMIWKRVVNFIARCYTRGCSIDWQRFEEGFARQKITCPTYPFQQRSYWIKTEPVSASPGSHKRNIKTGNPLIGEVESNPLPVQQVTFALSLDNLPQLRDTHGLIHIGFFVELLYSGMHSCGYTFDTISSMVFDMALLISPGEQKTIQLLLEKQDDGRITFSFHSFNEEPGQWMQHVHGETSPSAGASSTQSDTVSLQSMQKKLTHEQTGSDFYQEMKERGLELGASVQWIDHIHRKDGEVLARFRTVGEQEAVPDTRLNLNPGILDACAQLFHATLNATVPKDSRFMVGNLDTIRFTGIAPSATIYCHVDTTTGNDEKGVVTGRFVLYTDTAEIIATCERCVMKELTAAHAEALKAAGEKASGPRNTQFLASLKEAKKQDKQVALIESYLVEKFSHILKIPREEISVTESILMLGFDSLVGLEFLNTIKSELGLELPIDILIQGPDITRLSSEMHQLIDLDAVLDNEHAPAEKRQAVRKKFDLKDHLMQKKLWVRGKKKRKARMQLYCFPYGHVSSAVFHSWVDAFPEEIEVRPIELPGRGDRLKERPIEHIEEICKKLTKVLGNDLRSPYTIYGHSAGGLIAYAWSLYLQKIKKPLPQRLFVAAFTAPGSKTNPVLDDVRKTFMKEGIDHIPTLEEILHPHSEDYIEKVLDCFMHTSNTVGLYSLSKDLIYAQLPAGVSALRTVELFDTNSIMPLNVPITALHGKNDLQVTREQMQEWEKLAAQSFSFKEFEGDHLFLNADQSEQDVIKYISTMLLK